MALTNAQLQVRIVNLEANVQALATALSNLADKKTLNSISVLRQKEVLELQTQVTAILSQITVLQNNLVVDSHSHAIGDVVDLQDELDTLAARISALESA